MFRTVRVWMLLLGGGLLVATGCVKSKILVTVKKDGSGTVVWESGSNRLLTTPASGSATVNDTWK